jgi:hypothetical protein
MGDLLIHGAEKLSSVTENLSFTVREIFCST